MNWLANQPTEAFTASKSECANHVELEAVAHVSRALCSVRFRRRRVSCLFWGTAQLQKRAGRSFDRAQKLPSLEAFVSSHLDLRDTSSVVCPLTHAPAKPGQVSSRAIEQFKLDYRVLPVRAQGWNGSPIQTGMPVTLISEL